MINILSIINLIILLLQISQSNCTFITRYEYTGNTTIFNNTSRRLASQSKRPYVTILVYDKIRGYLNWMQDWFRNAALKKCSTKCYLTENKDELKDADIVLFHAPTFQSLPSRYYTNSLFVLLSMEQPRYAPLLNNIDFLNQNFDLLATYSFEPKYPNSNVPNMPISYFPLNILSPKSILQPTRSFQEKNGYGTNTHVAMFVSNCKAAGASERLAYISELMKHIPIHSYGTCLHNRDEPNFQHDHRWPPLAQRRSKKIKVLSYYRFYLAFENLSVEDYVSEKIYEGLFAGTIPIYRGTKSIYKYMPSNSSFIDANELNPKQLADLIKQINKDETAYNQYFRFKREPNKDVEIDEKFYPLSKSFIDVTLKSYIHPNVLCRLCEYGLLARQSIHTKEQK